MASKSRTLCDACGRDVGLWQAAFTSECAHTFHLRCVSGRGACPECKAQWSDTPAVAPAPAPATPFSFASTPASSQPSSASLFGQQATATATASSFRCSSTPDFQLSLPGSSPQTTSNFSLFGSPPAFGSSSYATSRFSLFGSSTSSSFGTSLIGAQPPATPRRPRPLARSSIFELPAFESSSSATSSPTLFGSSSSPLFGSTPQTTSGSSPSTIPSSTPSFGSSLFGSQPPATPNPFWLAPTPPTDQSSSWCSVCHGSMGRGQATVTSECNHTFHLRCFSGSVCPVCGARWRDEVTMRRSSDLNLNPSSAPPLPNPSSTPPPLFSVFSFTPPNPTPTSPSPSPSPPPWTSLFNFNDDEPVEPPLEGWDTVPEVANNGLLVLTTHCEHPAVARDAAQEKFAVLVHAKAPVAPAEASERAPLDLVTVLDVSSSMIGSKIALLKQAMGFVIDQLGPSDRLSVVTFSCNARRIIRLTRMSDDGKAYARAAVESLRVESSTNIGDGLRIAAQVLHDRRHKNAVSSVILLSDGQDNHTMGYFGDSFGGEAKTFVDLVPHSLRRGGDGRLCTPVHTFGFGTDHDAAAMHAIAEVTGGTFSFIENEAVVQDSFAQCIGGLLSVAVQEARIAVECLHPGVRVRAVKSGCYKSNVDAGGRAGSVDVGELYAEEERRFLLFLDVPVAAAGDGAEEGDVTRLIKVSCTYKDAATGQSVDVAGEDAVVQRPVVVAADTEPSLDVARERFRVEATEDIAASQAAAERGAHAEAARILERRQEAASAAAGLAGDARCAALVAELRELRARVANRRDYEETGRACMLAGISAHAQQRASTIQLCMSMAASDFGGNGADPGKVLPPWLLQPTCGARLAPGAPACGASSFGAIRIGAPPRPPGAPMPACAAMPPPSFGSAYATPAMQGMVESSRKRRQQQEHSSGSRFDPK